MLTLGVVGRAEEKEPALEYDLPPPLLYLPAWELTVSRDHIKMGSQQRSEEE